MCQEGCEEGTSSCTTALRGMQLTWPGLGSGEFTTHNTMLALYKLPLLDSK